MPEKITILKDKIIIICWTCISELITNPNKAWTRLKRLSDGKKTPVFKSTLIAILLTGLVHSLGVILVSTELNFFEGIKSGVGLMFTMFISVYVSTFINLIALENILKREVNLSEIFNFTALLYGLTYLIYAISPFLTIVFFFKVFLLYTFYIAWSGTEYFIDIPQENRVVYTTICGFSVFLSPLVINKILTLLMPGLL